MYHNSIDWDKPIQNRSRTTAAKLLKTIPNTEFNRVVSIGNQKQAYMVDETGRDVMGNRIIANNVVVPPATKKRFDASWASSIEARIARIEASFNAHTPI